MKPFILSFVFFSFFLFTQAQEERARIMIETDSGSLVIELFNETPLHRDNFLKLANEGFYDGTTFHRVIEEFMIQGGDPNTKEGGEGAPGNGGPGYTVPAEFNPMFVHHKGMLCAARKGDNVNPKQASSGSQFYIVQGRTFSEDQINKFEKKVNNAIRNRIARAFFLAPENEAYLKRLQTAKGEGNMDEVNAVLEEVDPFIDAKLEDKTFAYTEEQKAAYQEVGGTPHLDMQYTVFGQVIEGLDVIDKIASVEKSGERPVNAARMTVRVLD